MRIQISLVLLSAILASGCAEDPKPPPATPTGPTEPAAEPTETAVAEPQDQDDPTRGNIQISDEIRKACGITEAEAYFAFDSARVRPEDRVVFGKLAKCFTDGPLAGREMRLVGHADPRGEDEYNMLLGEKRAANVKSSIVAEGMNADKATTTSRGEMDATGTDEASWAKDRRVDVVLGD